MQNANGGQRIPQAECVQRMVTLGTGHYVCIVWLGLLTLWFGGSMLGISRGGLAAVMSDMSWMYWASVPLTILCGVAMFGLITRRLYSDRLASAAFFMIGALQLFPVLFLVWFSRELVESVIDIDGLGFSQIIFREFGILFVPGLVALGLGVFVTIYYGRNGYYLHREWIVGKLIERYKLKRWVKRELNQSKRVTADWSQGVYLVAYILLLVVCVHSTKLWLTNDTDAYWYSKNPSGYMFDAFIGPLNKLWGMLGIIECVYIIVMLFGLLMHSKPMAKWSVIAYGGIVSINIVMLLTPWFLKLYLQTDLIKSPYDWGKVLIVSAVIYGVGLLHNSHYRKICGKTGGMSARYRL